MITNFLNKHDRAASTVLIIANIILFIVLLFVVYQKIDTRLQIREDITNKYNIQDEQLIYFHNTDNSSLEYLEDAIELLPDSLSDKLIDKGWKIIITDDFLSNGFELPANKMVLGECLGFVSNNTRYVFLKPATSTDLTMCLMHELGHVFDKYSNTSEFKNLYEMYKEIGYYGHNESPTIQYAIVDELEFFATTFKDYFLYPFQLQEKAPEVFEYFEMLNNTQWN